MRSLEGLIKNQRSRVLSACVSLCLGNQRRLPGEEIFWLSCEGDEELTRKI